MTKTHENQDMSEYCDKYGWENERHKQAKKKIAAEWEAHKHFDGGDLRMCTECNT